MDERETTGRSTSPILRNAEELYTRANPKTKWTRRELGAMVLGLGASQLLARRARAQAARTGPLVYAVIGDYGEASQTELEVSQLVKSWSPEFIVTNGDNNYGDEEHPEGSAATLDKNVGQYYREFIYPYKGSFGPGADINRFFPILADKDYNPTEGYAPYLDYFTLPGHERYYDFVWGPVHFFMLNSDTHEPDGRKHPSAQSAWLQARLAASTSPWKVVHIHHPPYSSYYLTSVTQWPFAEWGAHVVISGQRHFYERIHRDGIVYFINGLGGKGTASFKEPVEGSVVRYRDECGAQRVTATPESLTFEFFTLRGELIDTYTLGDDSSLLAAPIALSAGAVSMTQIDLRWSENSGNEEGFEIERSAEGGPFTLIAAVGPNQTTYSDTDLGTGTRFVYRARAFSASRVSAYSNTAAASLPNLTAPTNLRATADSDVKIKLAWQDNANAEVGFEIERSTDGVNFTLIKRVGANVTSYGSGSLAPETRYYYRVRAYDATGKSLYSNVANATTKIARPTSPANLTATAVSSSQIDVAWTDNATETGYKIYRSLDGVSFNSVKTLGQNVTSYSDTGRIPGTTYYYQVRAFNESGNSGASSTASATTLA